MTERGGLYELVRCIPFLLGLVGVFFCAGPAAESFDNERRLRGFSLSLLGIGSGLLGLWLWIGNDLMELIKEGL